MRQHRVQLPVAAQGGGRLQDGIEPPARGTVDEKANQDALIEQAGTGLQSGTGQEQERKKVVMDTQIQRGYRDANEKEGDEDAVDGQIPRKTALKAEVIDLARGDGEEDYNDDGECELCARFNLKVMWGESLDGDKVKGVVVQGSDPGSAQPEDCFLNVRGQVGQLRANTIAVNDGRTQRGGEEAANDQRG